MLRNRVVLGIEADGSFPTFPDPATGLTIGGTSNFTSPTFGAGTFSENVLASGTVRGRIGYAPGHWLFYATGGLAWTYDHQTLTQTASRQQRRPLPLPLRLGRRPRRRDRDRAVTGRSAANISGPTSRRCR